MHPFVTAHIFSPSYLQTHVDTSCRQLDEPGTDATTQSLIGRSASFAE